MKKDFLLSVVIPAYNEEEVIAVTCSRLVEIMLKSGYRYELIFVDDGSKDKTASILSELAAQNPSVKMLSFSRNFGHQAAVSAGLAEASGDCVVVIDADLQDPPEVIDQMVALWQEGWEVVYGKRASREGETIFKKLSAKMFYRLLASLTNVDIPVDTGDFRLVDRKVVDVLNRMPERNRFMRGLVSWVGFRQTPVEFTRAKRFAGTTKYPLKKMIKFAMDGIFSLSSVPLKALLKVGAAMLVIAFLIFVYAIVSFIMNNAMAGWTSLIAVVTFFGGANFIAIGLLGEYVARIYDEVKGRPNYIVAEERNFDDRR